MGAARRPHPARFQAFDLLPTLVAVVAEDGTVLFANAALESAIGLSWRSIEGTALTQYFAEADTLQHALEGVRGNQFAALRYDAQLKPQNGEPLAVHAIVAQTERAGEIIVELLPLE